MIAETGIMIMATVEIGTSIGSGSEVRIDDGNGTAVQTDGITDETSDEITDETSDEITDERSVIQEAKIDLVVTDPETLISN